MRVLALVLGTLCTVAHAADTPAPKALTSQQSKMATCNQEAGDKKGDERKAFMKQCLSKQPVAETQQDKMKRCNAEAQGKTGDARKAFMSECLKGAAKKA